jgi:HAD superfamily hydrolase (TIGR01509 family)
MKKDKRFYLSRRFDVFVFDWDGTLNSIRLVTRINEAIKRALGIWNRDSTIKDFRSMDYNLKRRLERKEEYKGDIVSVLADLLLIVSKPKLHNDSLELLKSLKRRGKKVAVLSNCGRHRLLSELSYLRITGYFDIITSAREIRAPKPNPTGLRAIAHFLGAKPGSVLYVGDMVDDVLTAKLAGMHSCAVADGFDSYHTLKSARPDYIFNGIEGLKAAL